MNISILSFKYAVQSSLIGPLDIMSQINALVEWMSPELNVPEINVNLVHSNELPGDLQFDLVIIPAMQFDKIEEVIATNRHLISWVKKQYEGGAEIASICLGAFLLAETGLLNNSCATTHWLGADFFRKRYPKINLVDDKFITDYQRLYTSGGAYSFTTLMIYLIDKYFGSEVAVLISKVFLIHLHDQNQRSFKILAQQKNHSIGPIIEIQNYIESNLAETLNIEELAVKANMSQRTFMRKFKKATGDTPNTYIQKVKVEKAKKLLETGNTGIEQICFRVGYNDFASFRKVFKKQVGLNPSEYKKLYTRAFTSINVAGKTAIQQSA